MKKTRSSLQAWTLSAGLPLVFKWRLNAPAGFEVCTWDSCHSPLSVFSNPSFHVAPQSLRGKRENFLQEFFVFGFFFLVLWFELPSTWIRFLGHLQGAALLEEFLSSVKIFSKQEIRVFGARRFCLKDFSSEEVNP